MGTNGLNSEKPLGEEAGSANLTSAAGLEIENFVIVGAADGGGVGTFNIIRFDFQVGNGGCPGCFSHQPMP